MSAKPGRNDPCPCGSGKKYKRCCIDKAPPTPLRPVPAEGDEPPPPAPANSPRPFDSRKEDKQPRPRTEFDDWYEVFEASSDAHKLEMARDLLAQDRPTGFFEENDFVGVLLELRDMLGTEQESEWVSLVREMQENRPDVFRLGAGYFVRDMAYYYVRMDQTAAVNEIVAYLVAEALPPDEMTYDLLDLLHLTGLHESARLLVMDAVSRMDQADLLPWATDELTSVAMFFPFHAYIAAGCTDDGFAKLKEELAALGYRPDPEHLNQIIAHRAGRSDRQFTWDDFATKNDPGGFNLYLLTLDFARWLTVGRNMPAVTAEAMRSFLHDCLLRVSHEKRTHPLYLPQAAIDEYLARNIFGFMSLQQPRGFATLIALRHFTDFLKTLGLIDEKRHELRSSFWEQLWSNLQTALREGWCDYSFLMRWW